MVIEIGPGLWREPDEGVFVADPKAALESVGLPVTQESMLSVYGSMTEICNEYSQRNGLGEAQIILVQHDALSMVDYAALAGEIGGTIQRKDTGASTDGNT